MTWQKIIIILHRTHIVNPDRVGHRGHAQNDRRDPAAVTANNLCKFSCARACIRICEQSVHMRVRIDGLYIYLYYTKICTRRTSRKLRSRKLPN